MTNTGRHLAAMSFAAFGLVQFLPADSAFAQQRRTQPQETLMMHGVRTTPEISAKCEAFIDRTFGRGTGSEIHRSAGLAACIERGGNRRVMADRRCMIRHVRRGAAGCAFGNPPIAHGGTS